MAARRSRPRAAGRAGERALLDRLPTAVLGVDTELRLNQCNTAAERVFGFSRDELMGRSPAGLLVPLVEWPGIKGRLLQLLQGDGLAQAESQILHKDGRVLMCLCRYITLRDAHGRATGILATTEDVTELRRVEEELRRRTEQYRRILSNIPDVAWTAAEAGNAVFISDGILEHFGFTAEEVYAGGEQHWFGRIHPDDRARVQAAYQALFRSGVRFDVEYRIRHRDGHWIWWHDRSVAVYERDGTRYADGLLSDVTERKIVEERLLASEDRYRQLFDANPHPMWVFDRETLRFLAVNDAAVGRYGYTRDEFLGMRILDIRPPEDASAVMEEVRGGALGVRATGEWRHRRKDGSILDVEVTGHTMTFAGRPATLILASDVTERRVLEQQLQQAQKMEAVGQLTGGIAHDLNNVLTAVLANLGFVAMELPPEAEESRADLEEARQAALRGADMIRKLLAFSRREPLKLEALQLDQLVTEFGRTLRRMLPESLEIRIEPAPDIAPILADAAAVHQILLNLATNARDAMPDGGTLGISLEPASLDDVHVATHGWGEPGRYVCLAVSDTGVGMDAETRKRLFEPFFTTKPTGRGTGLGMAMVYGLMKQHRGFVFVYSEPGHGSVIKLYFPVGEKAPGVPQPAPAPLLGGSETILVVEDEPAIRHAARRALERVGYRVLAAADGVEALEVLEQMPGVALVVTDVIMPRLGGFALYEAAREKLPGVRFLFTSGYTGADVREQYPILAQVPFIAKPWTVDELLDRVAEVLGRKRAPERS